MSEKVVGVAVNTPKMPAPASINFGRMGIEIRTLEDLGRVASMCIKANMVPKGVTSEAQVALIIQFGMELGLGIMASIQNVYLVNNKPKLYGPIGLGIVQASGQLEHYNATFEGTPYEDGYKAIVELRRTGDEGNTKTEFSVLDAKTAKLWGTNNWSTYPKDMLYYRALWRGLERRFSDLLRGIGMYDPAEYVVDATSVETISTKSDALAEKLEGAVQ